MCCYIHTAGRKHVSWSSGVQMHFWSNAHMLSLSKKKILKFQQIQEKITWISPNSMCTRTAQEISRDMSYFSTKVFSCLHCISMKNLYDHVGCKYMHSTFCFVLLKYLEIGLKCISNKGSIWTWQPKCRFRKLGQFCEKTKYVRPQFFLKLNTSKDFKSCYVLIQKYS
jgi:hypothetical protein